MKWAKRLGIGLGSIVALLVLWAAAGALVYSPEYVSRVLTSRESSVDDYHRLNLAGIPAGTDPEDLTVEQRGVVDALPAKQGQDAIYEDYLETDTGIEAREHAYDA